MQTTILQTSSGLIEIEIPLNIIDSICTSGSNDLAVENAINDETIKAQWDKISDHVIDKEFNEIGFDLSDDEKQNLSRLDKIKYLLWNMCWDYIDNN